MRASRQGWRADQLGDTEVLLLRAAGHRKMEPALSAWRSFQENVPEDNEDVAERRLLPLVCRNLLKLGHAREPYLAQAYAEAFGATAHIVGQAAPALQALRDASIKTMVLKGTALVLAHYRDLGVRPMSDVDILVPKARVGEALDVLERAGWRGDPSRAWLKAELHAGTITSPSGLTLDLHRHATYEARFESADEAFFRDSVSLEVSGVRTSAMSASDQLLHTVVHGLRWSIARSPIWVMDAATILRGGAVDTQKTVDRAADLHLTLALERGLQMVRSTLGGEEPLDALLESLTRHPSTIEDRIEHNFRVSEPDGVLGALPNLWFAYRRSEAGGCVALSGFPPFLLRAWRLGPNQSLGRLMLAKAWRRLRR